jgi:signal transduction histidine kinase
MLDSLPGAFSQVLTNLVMNALLHAFEPEQSGHIDISVAAINSTQLRLTFSDDGKGIAPELHTRVFEPFFTTRRANGGSGLGLHIVHNIVTQALKGTLTLHSRVGEGATFTLLLPRSLADTVVPAPALLSPSESRT